MLSSLDANIVFDEERKWLMVEPFTVECGELRYEILGVVIVTCKTKDNRDEILSAKKMLQFSK